MNQFLIEIICSFFRWSGLPLLIREIFARRRVTIVNYHDPAPEVFALHLSYYARHYNLISIDKLSNALHSGHFSSLPAKSLLITLDDGHCGNEALFTEIERYQAPITIYAVAGVVDTNFLYWFKAPGLTPTKIANLKNVTDSERRKIIHNEYGRLEGCNGERQGLSLDALLRLQRVGATIGNHTITHPLLTRCTPDASLNEIFMAKEALERKLGCDVLHFAYPGGDWNEVVKTQVAAAGHVTARTIQPGFVKHDTDPLTLPNFGIADDASLNKAILQASGIWTLFKSTIGRGNS